MGLAGARRNRRGRSRAGGRRGQGRGGRAARAAQLLERKGKREGRARPWRSEPEENEQSGHVVHTYVVGS